MFIAANFQSIRDRCLTDFEAFLRQLKISVPNCTGGDEYRIYDNLDSEIVSQLCARMKSDSIINGYYGLLKLGGIAYDYSDTDNELLGKIVANKNKILQGLNRKPEPVHEELPPQPASPTKRKITTTKTDYETKHETLPGPIILGAILILGALLFIDSSIGVGVLVVLGLLSAGAGIRGKDTKIPKTIQVETEVESPAIRQPVQKSSPVRAERQISFTRDELQQLLDILTRLDKIVRSI